MRILKSTAAALAAIFVLQGCAALSTPTTTRSDPFAQEQYNQ